MVRRCSGWLRLSTALGLGHPPRRIELRHPWSEDGVKGLQSIAERPVLPRPIPEWSGIKQSNRGLGIIEPGANPP
jgi:hypothetical protein